MRTQIKFFDRMKVQFKTVLFFAVPLALIIISLSIYSKNGVEILVTSSADSGDGSLRAAIEVSNATDIVETILISDAVQQSGIFLSEELPTIERPALLIGDRSKGRTSIHFTDDSRADFGIQIAADNVTVQGFNLSGYVQSGILILEANDVTVSNNVIGGEVDEAKRENIQTKDGISIVRSSNSTIIDNQISGHLKSGIAITPELILATQDNESDNYLRNLEDVEKSYAERELVIKREPLGGHTLQRNIVGMLSLIHI